MAPLWAELAACVNSSLGKRLGDLPSLVYTQIATVLGTFHDITSGSNGAYSAAAGWDACTGWGSPIGSAILSALTGKLPAGR